MHLTKTVERGCLRINSHPASSMFMDRFSRRIDPTALVFPHLRLCFVEKLLNSIVHLFRHLPLVLTMFEDDLWEWHSILIKSCLINLNSILFARRNFTIRVHGDPSR